MSTSFDPLQIILGILLAAIIAAIAWRFKLLSKSGALAALVLGAIIFGLGGLPWAVLLLVFFTSSSLLSRFARGRKSTLDEKYSKGSQRDAWQVIANGGVAGAILLLAAIQRKLFGCSDACFAANGWAFLAFAGSLAAANADTWATEMGVLSPREPRLITSGKVVARGSSGGVTLAGSLAALAGALLIAALAAIPWSGIPHTLDAPLLVLMVMCAGLAGSFVDSLLGATLQAIYHCPACERETEKHPRHTCGSPTRLVRGLDWFDNDTVNLTCTLAGAFLVWLVYMLIR